jgi:hypothetical protein
MRALWQKWQMESNEQRPEITYEASRHLAQKN